MNDDIKALICQTALGKETLSAIGRITANFAILELKLTKLIYFLLGSDEETALIVASEKSFSGLQDLAVALIIKHVKNKTLDFCFVENFKELAKAVSLCEQKRNTISHSLFGFGLKPGETIRTKYSAKRRHGLSFQREVMSLEDFENIYNSISTSAYEIDKFCGEIKLAFDHAEVLIKGLDKSKLAIA
jgi:hypothetical protein